MKDKSYRATPLGLVVARYIRWKRNEWGASPETIRDYEPILAKLAVFFADLELADFAPPVGQERLRECWDHHWGDLAPRTRAKVRSVWVDFFEWAFNEGMIVGNPARALAAPKKRDVPTETFPPSLVARVIAAQPYPADEIGTTLILHYGVRRGGVANAQRKHFDFERRMVTVHTKGGRIYPVQVPEEAFWNAVGRLELEAQWQPDDFLLYRQDTRRRRVHVDEATEVLQLGGERVGYADVTTRDHAKLGDLSARVKIAHRWWYRCLQRADVVAPGVTRGANMHRGRHTAATALQRSTHDSALTQKMLGHLDPGSTARYIHLDNADLAAALANLYGGDD